MQRLKDEQEEKMRRKAVEDIREDGERLVNEIRLNKRKDRRAIESKDGAIEDNINCKFQNLHLISILII